MIDSALGRSQAWIYVTNFEVSIPGDRAQACLAAVANTAAQLQLECTWEAV